FFDCFYEVGLVVRFVTGRFVFRQEEGDLHAFTTAAAFFTGFFSTGLVRTAATAATPGDDRGNHDQRESCEEGSLHPSCLGHHSSFYLPPMFQPTIPL